MSRYAVLGDLDTPNFTPIGLLIELGEKTQAIWAKDIGLRKMFDRSFDEIVSVMARSFLVSAIFNGEDSDEG
jgi:hypothetical protein